MLKLEDISKYYYSSSNVTCALRKINLEFKIGEFVAITGESGSGKTTLLNVISGLDTYEDGEMYYYDKKSSFFDDEDWEKYRKEEIAFIFQNYNLIDSYTVLENVMATYIIDGYTKKEAKIKAIEKLKLVGLDKDLHKKAIKLSGGQKQRLSIARVLAKETNIIVADEPTGNLDVENGDAVLKILKELSKDKLVIVVTHNQAQIEPFATRKIRLHDGEITSDVTVNEVPEKKPVIKEPMKFNAFRRIMDFSLLNIKSQPKKSLLLIILILFATLSSFVFIENFKINLDDTDTKKIDDSFFENLGDKRLLVRKMDGSAISDEELELARVENVVSVEKYDYITDINYYRPGDYRMKLDGETIVQPDGSVTFIDSSFTILVNNDKFMRSYLDLSIDMLSAGQLPTGSMQMVVYSDDISIIGTKEIVLFKNEKLFGADSWYQYEVEIVGILKNESTQAYFSEDICKVLDMTQYNFSIKVEYSPRNSWRKEFFTFNKIVIDPNIPGGYNAAVDKTRLNSLDGGRFLNELYYSVKQEWIPCSVSTSYTQNVSPLALALSEELFNELYMECKVYNQFALYISDYAYTEQVRDELIDLGYESISCYKVSVAGYDHDKVVTRYINLFISIVALIVVNLVTVLISYAILKVKKNDYVIFKMIGLSNNDSKKINYIEVLSYGIISNILLIISTIIVKNTVTNSLITDIFKYVKITDYLIVFAITMISMICLGRLFAKFLTNKVKITVLKEE